MEIKKVCVLGGSGFVGRHVISPCRAQSLLRRMKHPMQCASLIGTLQG
jgi:nucleoside-diphosphate-sugar epimerase